MLREFLRRRQQFHECVRKEAGDLQTFMGDFAYAEARNRARTARAKGDRAADMLWTKVAAEIADQIGLEVGIKGADRYPPPPPRVDPKRREIADRIVEIARGLAALSTGGAEATTLHNIGVAARQILDFAGRTPALEEAVADVIEACEHVTLPRTQEALHAGVYPPAVEEATRALRKLQRLSL